MPSNKIGYPGAPSFQPMQAALSPGEVFPVPFGQGVVGTFGSFASQFTGFTLSGQYYCTLGPYLSLQQYDSNLDIWRNVHAYSGGPHFISSDGTNYRIANTTGTPVAALITNAGSSLTNGFNTVTVTPSAGGSVWNTIVGGAINTTVTITTAGTGYLFPPVLVFNPPLGQGSTPYILPTAICTISGGAINAVTVTNQGAGLVAAPTITVINQPMDAVGAGGVLTVNATLAGSGTLTWMGVDDNGTGLTAVPTFTFSPASTIAATAIMNFTVTGLTTTAAGATYPNATNFPIIISGGTVAGSAANTNPNYDKLWIMPRVAQMNALTTATTFTGATITTSDAGFGFQAIPNAVFPSYQGTTVQAVLTPTVGGQNDFFSIQPV